MYILTVHVHVIVIRNFVFTTFFNEHCVQRHSHRNTCRLNRRLKEQYVAGDKSNRNARLLALNFKKNHRHGKPPSLLKCSFSEVKRNYVQEENTVSFYDHLLHTYGEFQTFFQKVLRVSSKCSTIIIEVSFTCWYHGHDSIITLVSFTTTRTEVYILAGENGMMKWSATISRK